MAKKRTNDEKHAADPSFEDALHRLADAVRQLEEGNLSLDDSLARYEEGIRYLSQCQKILENAERKIELLSGFDAEGNPIIKSVDDEVMSLEQKADGRSRRRSATQETATSRTMKQAKIRTDNVHVGQVAESESSERSSRSGGSTAPQNAAAGSDAAPVTGEEDDVDGNGRLF